MKKDGFVCRLLLPCFSPTGTTTTTTTTRTTKFSTMNDLKAVDVTTTTTTKTTSQRLPSTTGRINNTTNRQVPTHQNQRYIDHPYQANGYYDPQDYNRHEPSLNTHQRYPDHHLPYQTNGYYDPEDYNRHEPSLSTHQRYPDHVPYQTNGYYDHEDHNSKQEPTTLTTHQGYLEYPYQGKDYYDHGDDHNKREPNLSTQQSYSEHQGKDYYDPHGDNNAREPTLSTHQRHPDQSYQGKDYDRHGDDKKQELTLSTQQSYSDHQRKDYYDPQGGDNKREPTLSTPRKKSYQPNQGKDYDHHGGDNNKQEHTLSTNQRYLAPANQTVEYYGHGHEDSDRKISYGRDDDEESWSPSSSATDGALDYYPNSNNRSISRTYNQKPPRPMPPHPTASSAAAPIPIKSVVTGTFYGHRQGHICFCIQKDRHNCTKPPLLLELSIPTDDLVKEMQRELVRIVLECDSSSNKSSGRLLSIPIWTMHVNGRKVGFAAKRRPTEKDCLILKTIQSTSVGAGVIPKELAAMASPRQGGGGGGGAGNGDELIFMRANYRRVVGSVDTESFHLTNPDGCVSTQELSVFLMRSH